VVFRRPAAVRSPCLFFIPVCVNGVTRHCFVIVAGVAPLIQQPARSAVHLITGMAVP
jgi:hypothetical protein